MSLADEVAEYLVSYMMDNGGVSSEWRAGATAEPVSRLFADHAVDRSRGLWAYKRAESESAARRAERALLRIGCAGGAGDGGRPLYVYVYRKVAGTRE